MKNYTSLEKMKASEVAPSFTEEKVTAETFPQEVAKGTLYKGFEPPKDATMLKFRYYSPDGTLIEQNNVPVVYDGTGIESVVTYYLLTDKKDGITVDSKGWTDEVQTVTAEKRFLWTYTKTTYTNKAFACTDPCITAVFGEQGERGAMYLGHYASDQDADKDNKPAVFTGDYYLNTTDSFLYVYNKENNIWAKINDLTDYRYNQSINDIFEAINDTTKKEEFLKAKIAWVQNLSAAIARVQMLLANEIQLTSAKDLEKENNTTGGIIRSANYDGTTQNGKITKAGTAGWAIDYDGKAEFNNVTVRGTVDGSVVKGSTIEGGSITIGSNFSVNNDGNTEIKGGIININDNFIVDKDGNLTAKAGSFSGLLKQGCNFYIATRLTITYNGTEWSCKCSNALYKDFSRVAQGRFMLHLPAEDISKGLPRVITHYCSDKRMSNGQAPTIENVINNTYYPGGSNPEYQISCRSGLNVSAGDYNFDWIPLYFTDNNNDDFQDPVYAILTLIYI
jgi:hypothetical protein|nr:MAG TPA_asm: hypothetical protein [Caudoviricetes sp.]